MAATSYTLSGATISTKVLLSSREYSANATSKKVIDQFKGTDVIFGKSKGVIWGSAGLIVAFAKMEKLDAVCLMGETSFLDVDASAAKAVIIQLAKKLNLKINTADLDKIIERTARAIKELEKQVGNLNQGQQQYALPLSKDEDEHRPSYIR